MARLTLSEKRFDESAHRLAALLVPIILLVPAVSERCCGAHSRRAGPFLGAGAPSAVLDEAHGSSLGKARAPGASRPGDGPSGTVGRGGAPGIASKHDSGARARDHTLPVVSYEILNGQKNRLGEFGPMVRLSLSAGAGGSAAEAIFWRPAETPGWRRYTGTVALGPLWKRRVSSVEFRAIDRAGNRSLVARFAFRIDDVAPDLPPLRVGRYQTGRRPGTFVGSEGIFVPPFEPGAILEYRLDDGDFTPCQIGQTIRPPSDGVFTITFRIRDELGNSQSRTFRIKTDSTPPKTTIRFD